MSNNLSSRLIHSGLLVPRKARGSLINNIFLHTQKKFNSCCFFCFFFCFFVVFLVAAPRRDHNNVFLWDFSSQNQLAAQ